ncbi:MAG: N-acetylglucosamine-6-phosphate deacetylase [Granulosicoccus sp.]
MKSESHYSGIDPASGLGKTLIVSDGIIQATRPCSKPDLPVFSPGLVDLQVNGYNGIDLNSGSLKATTVDALSQALCEVGVAAYLPTLITASEKDLCERLEAIAQAHRSLSRSNRMIAGIHVEGPSVSAEDGPRGAHPVEHVRPPSIEEFERWQQAADGLICMITIAPELPGACEYIRQVADQGVCVSLGHCNATEDDIHRAVEAGARMSTHLGNGIASTLPRHPNAIWAQLADDQLNASLIVDQHHLPGSTVRSMIRAKGKDKVILVSDSVKFAGMSPGRYTSPIGGEVDVGADGRVSVAGTVYLAGSGKCLLDIVTHFSQFTRLPFADGIAMATSNPAMLLGRSVKLQSGEPASFIVFDVEQSDSAATVRDIVFEGVTVLR